MKNYDELVKINNDPNWAYIPDFPTQDQARLMCY